MPQKTYLVDAFGRPSWNSGFRSSSNRPLSAQIDAQDNVTYVRFDQETEGSVIQRFSVNDTVTTCTVGFGRWEDRATLEYGEINKPLLVPHVASIWARI